MRRELAALLLSAAAACGGDTGSGEATTPPATTPPARAQASADARLQLTFRPLAVGEPEFGIRRRELALRVVQDGADPRTHFGEMTSSQASAWMYALDATEEDGTRRMTYVLLHWDSTRTMGTDRQSDPVPAHAHKAFDVVLRPDGAVEVRRKGGEPVSEEELRGLQEVFAEDPTSVDIGRFLAEREWVRGRWLDAPERVAGLMEASTARFRWVGPESRWHHDVERFEVEVTAFGASEGERATGALWVDARTGRPLLVALHDSTHRVVPNATGDGTWTFLRSWSYGRTSLRPTPVPQTAPAGRVTGVAFAPDGHRAAVVSADGQVALYDVRSRKAASIEPVRDPEGARFSEDGGYLAVWNDVGVYGWMVGDTVGMRRFGSVPPSQDDLRDLAMLGIYVVAAYETGRVVFWNPGHERAMGVLEAGADIRALDVRGDRLLVVTADGRALVHRVDLYEPCERRGAFCREAEVRATPQLGQVRLGRADVLDGALIDDGRALFATTEGAILEWSLSEDRVEPIAARGRCIALGGEGRVVTDRGAWSDGGRGAPLATWDASAEPLCALSADGRLAIHGNPDAPDAVTLADVDADVAIETLTASTRPISNAFALARDSLILQLDRGLLRWDLREPSTSQEEITGTLIAASADRRVTRSPGRLHVAGSGEQWTIDVPSSAPVVAATDASALAILRDGKLQAWDLSERRPMAEVSLAAGASLQTFALSSGSSPRLVALTDDARLLGWSLPSGSPLFEVRLAQRAADSRIAFTRDAERVVVTGLRGVEAWNPAIPVLRVVEAATGEVVRDLTATWNTVTAVTFTPDGREVVAGTEAGGVLTWDVRSGMLWSQTDAHQGPVTAVGFLAEDAELFTASRDGRVHLWDAGGVPSMRERFGGNATANVILESAGVYRDTRLRATLVAAGGSPIVVLPDGYYLADRRALDRVGFSMAGQSYDFEQFDARTNRPDVVLERLGRGRTERIALHRAAVARRHRRLGIEGPEDAAAAPELELLAEPPASVGADAVTLRVRVAPPEGGSVERLHVAVSSVPLWGTAGRAIEGGGETTVRVPLVPGRNRIQIWAQGSDGASSRRLTRVVSSTRAPRRPELYVVAVGVSDYAQDTLDLVLPSKDARDFVASMQGAAGAYERIHVHQLLDAEATRDRILAARSFLEQAGPQDVAMVFFAGHGLLDRDLTYYFGTADIDPAAPAERGLSFDAMAGLLDGVAVRRKLLLVDTCHAGEVDAETERGVASAAMPAAAAPPGTRGISLVPQLEMADAFELMGELFADLRNSSGTTIIAAARGDELAEEADRWNNGAFTRAVVEALGGDGADADGDGDLHVSELIGYVSERVERLTAGRQRPTARRLNLELDFVVK